MEQARQEALKAQQVRQQQQALKALDARMKKGGVVYRLSGKAKQDKEDKEIMQERLGRSRRRGSRVGLTASAAAASRN